MEGWIAQVQVDEDNVDDFNDEGNDDFVFDTWDNRMKIQQVTAHRRLASGDEHGLHFPSEETDEARVWEPR